jgi:RNA polymerase sigma factor (sigma-70 family)
MSSGSQPATEVPTGEAAPASWSDTRLVRGALAGNEQAWTAIIQRYKRLIYSIPLKYDMAPEDAGDIFQSVCLELFSELANLRKPESLKSWLISVTVHKCFRWKRQQRGAIELDAMEQEQAEATAVVAPQLLEDVEREQAVRDAIAGLPARCAEMIRLLFYEQPPVPYAEVARRLGLATGSIGFIRGRCLERLRKLLEEVGL